VDPATNHKGETMRKNNSSKTENKDTCLEYQISVAHRAGACKNYTQAEFKKYLLNIGLAKYMKVILPVENIKAEYELPECPQRSKTKIIPFFNVTLEKKVTG